MKNKYYPYIFISILFVLNIFIWSFNFSLPSKGILKVYFLDIGQGDSILVVAPNNHKILIDGGPDTSVLGELGKVMGFFDRHIDIILATHPDQDHIAGLPLVLGRYKVDDFVDSIADWDTSAYKELERKAKEENITTWYGKRGMIIVLDRKHGVYLHILYPVADDFTLTDNNDLSIVAKLVYGNISFMLTGDATKLVENMLDSTDGTYLKSDVLKAGHHGSDTSSSKTFVDTVAPNYAVISAGLNNKYGHPKPITIKTLSLEGADILKTYELGTIEFDSDGENLWLKNQKTKP
jgi:competence protein ComEC